MRHTGGVGRERAKTTQRGNHVSRLRLLCLHARTHTAMYGRSGFVHCQVRRTVRAASTFQRLLCFDVYQVL